MNNNNSKVLLSLYNYTILTTIEYTLVFSSTVLVEKEKAHSELDISFILFDNSTTIGHTIFKTNKNIDLTVSDYNITYPITNKIYGLGIELENIVSSVVNNSSIVTPLNYELGYIRSERNLNVINKKIIAKVNDEFKDQMNKYLDTIIEKLNKFLLTNSTQSVDVQEIIE